MGAAAQSQPVARRRGRRIGATAMSVHHAKKRPPTGIAVHIVPSLRRRVAGMKILYSTTATATGDGRNGHTATEDGLVDVDVRVPAEMGGAGGATNPGSSSRPGTWRASTRL